MYRNPTNIINKQYTGTSRKSFIKEEHIPKNYVSQDKINKLFSIINNGDYNAIIEYIINENNVLNVKDVQTKMNPLHALINNTHSNMTEQQKWNLAKKLLDYGVAVNDYNDEGNTPLHLAVKQQLFSVAKLLLDRGADPNSVNKQNQTPLFMLINISPCKPEKRVGALIPKPKENPDIKKNFSEITDEIMAIFKEDPVPRYFNHIKNTCATLDKIFDEEFYINDNSYVKTLIRDLADKIPKDINPITKKTVMHDINSVVNTIYDDMVNKLPKMTQPMDISPYQKNGWGPDNKESNKILPHKSFSDILQQFENANNTYLFDIFTDISSNIDNFAGLLRKSENYMVNIYNSTHNIIDHPISIIIAYKIATNPGNKKEKINKAINSFIDKNIPNKVKNNLMKVKEKLLADLDDNKKDNIGEIYNFFWDNGYFVYGDNEHIYIIQYLLDFIFYKNPDFSSVDVNILTNYNDDKILGNIILNSNKIISDSDINLADPIFGYNGRFYYNDDESSIYYTSKLDIAIHNIGKHYNVIAKNFELVKSVNTSKSYYLVVNKLFNQIILAILNAIQNINMGINEIDSQIKQTTDNIRVTMEQALLYRTDFLNDIIKYARKIRYVLLDMYDLLYKMTTNINKYIIFLNNIFAYNCMYFFNSANNSLTDAINDIEYDGIFSDKLKFIVLLPETLEKYNQKYFHLSGNQLKQKLYEDFIFNVNIYNYCDYIGATQNHGDLLYSRYAYDGTLLKINEVGIESIIGYLVDKINFVPLPRLPYGETSDGYDRLNDSNNDNTGNLGHIGSAESKTIDNPMYPVIGKYLDDHIYIIRYRIIKHIIENINIEDLNNVMNHLGMSDDTLESVIYTTIGKIADQLAIGYTNYSIRDGITTYVLKKVSGKDMNYNTQNIIDKLKSKITFNTDIGFSVNYNKLLDELVQGYLGNLYYGSEYDPDLLYDNLKISEPLMETVDTSKQYKVIDQNYNLAKPIAEDMCYHIDLDMFKHLVKAGSKINTKDSSLSTILHIALETLHVDLIKESIFLGAEIDNPTLKNSAGRTPYEHFIEMYNNHINVSENTNVIKRFTDSIYEDIKSELHDKPTFKFNTPDYLDILFPQLLIMFNGIFYYYMLIKLNGWNSNNNLINMANHYGYNYITASNLPLLDIPNIKHIKDPSKKVMMKKINSIGKSDTYADLEQHILSLIDRVNDISDEIRKLDNYNYAADKPMVKEYILKLSKEKVNKLSELTGLYYEVTNNNDMRHLETLFGEGNNNILNTPDFYYKNAYNFKGVANMNYNNATDKEKGYIEKPYNVGYSVELPSKMYELAFESVSNIYINNNDDTFGGAYTVYNEFWKDMVNSERIINISIPHVLCVYIQKKILAEKDARDLGDTRLINKLYNDILVPISRDFYEMPKELTDDNYIVTETFNIIAHIVKHILCVHMYKVIIRTIAEYLSHADGSLPESELGLFIGDEVRGMTKDKKLESYIIENMPEKITKISINIYGDDYDEDKEFTSYDTFFDAITDIITTSDTVLIARESQVIENIENYIYPYFKELFKIVIPKMWNVVNNYTRFIQNEGRYLDILTLLLKNMS